MVKIFVVHSSFPILPLGREMLNLWLLLYFDCHWILRSRSLFQWLLGGIFDIVLYESLCEVGTEHLDLVNRQVQEEITHHAHNESFQLLQFLFCFRVHFGVVDLLSFLENVGCLARRQGHLDLIETVFEDIDEFFLAFLYFLKQSMIFHVLLQM